MPDLVPVNKQWAANALVDKERYLQRYEESISDPEGFWGRQAQEFAWRENWYKVKNTSFESPVSIQWFSGGKLNITENCLDRYLPTHADRVAIFWEGDNPAESRSITYQQLSDEVCRLANVLKSQGVQKGDRVTIYLPMIPEAQVAMLACARIGAVHSVVFAGFSPDALKGRIDDCGSKLLITADESLRGGKHFPLKANADAALENSCVQKVVVVKRTGAPIPWQEGRDIWYQEALESASSECAPEIMDAEDPLFILYTSGSTGKPKGVLHTTAGYMIWVSITHKLVFDYQLSDIFWCTADIGWVTGHSYSVYGPLLNAASVVMFEGVPNYPDWSRFWQIIDRYKVTIFYTAPTAIRAAMREGDAPVAKTSRDSLRLLGSVGEPINPEAWEWYWHMVGQGRCPIVDTWWQTETGGIMITPLPGAMGLKPGSAALPFFGVKPLILDAQGKLLEGECEGLLCIDDSWPGQARSLWGDHKRFEQTYFSQFPGYYFTGDGARRDADGYYWITGRVDDVLNVSGHRLGTAEIEGALASHKDVAEAAVVGFPHEIKGQGIYTYVVLNPGIKPHDDLQKALKVHVRRVISAIATPDHIHFISALPKTRSGKIMRRILRKIAEGETENLGDISTLTNPEVVEELMRGK